jgi:hypothetical protein
VSLTLLACGKTSSPARTEIAEATPFNAPISNQVEVHKESADENDGHNGEEHTQPDPALATAEMGVALVPSELVVGMNRFAVGIFDAKGQAVNDAQVHFRYYDLSNPNAPVLESDADATPRQTADGLTTIFAQEREFDHAGNWGVEVQARFPDGSASYKRIGFQVLAESASPIPGEKVPTVVTEVSKDVNGDLSKLTSAFTPNPAFYQVSLADAITNGKPTVLLFATPAFCQTRFCGPSYDITSQLQQKYGDKINFIHVEIYTGLPDPSTTNWQLAPAMTAFGLSTEPWLFLLDRKGVVIYRVEGLFTMDEVEQYIPKALAS